MGAGASFTSSYPIELHDEIRAEYEKLKAEGKTDDEVIMQSLKEKFESKIAESQEQQKEEMPIPLMDPLPKKGRASVIKLTEVNVKGSPGKKKGGGRRQSFSPESIIPSPGKTMSSTMESIVESASSPQLNSPDKLSMGDSLPVSPEKMMEELSIQNKDSWDSVTAQPSCLICGMTFPSQTKLDRHVKYSSMHADAVKKLEAAKNGEADKVCTPVPEALKQKEGEHYKLLYSGTKFFWRTKDNIDIHIYLHILSDCVEVIPFDVERHRELNRSYLQHFILLSHIEKDAHASVEDRRKKLIDEKKQDKFNKTELPPDDVMLEEAKRMVMVTHILDRLQIQSGPPKQLTYVPNSISHNLAASNSLLVGDTLAMEKPALLNEPPSILEPVSLTRRRRSNAEDVREATARVDSMIHSVKKATGNAEKITELLFSSTGELNNIAKRMQMIRSMNFSKARLRWIEWIDRISIQYLVQRNTGIIDAYEARQKGFVGFAGVTWAMACKEGITRFKKSFPNKGACFFPDCMCHEEAGSPPTKPKNRKYLNSAEENDQRRIKNLGKAHEV